MASIVSDDDLGDDEVEAQLIKGQYACPVETCKTRGQTVAGVRHHITTVHRLNGPDFSPKKVPTPHGATVYGPQGEKVRVLLYPSGSIRVRVNDAGPMLIEEAFLTGEGTNVIVKLTPR